uniref:Uncharacterized protein n=1 Tax=viral metagenome TaxID=1070528 RepID=A0A6C0KWE2_9ZZZZ
MNPHFFISNCLENIVYSICLFFLMSTFILAIMFITDIPPSEHPICREVCLRQCNFNAICEFTCYNDCLKEIDYILASIHNP